MTAWYLVTKSIFRGRILSRFPCLGLPGRLRSHISSTRSLTAVHPVWCRGKSRGAGKVLVLESARSILRAVRQGAPGTRGRFILFRLPRGIGRGTRVVPALQFPRHDPASIIRGGHEAVVPTLTDPWLSSCWSRPTITLQADAKPAPGQFGVAARSTVLMIGGTGWWRRNAFPKMLLRGGWLGRRTTAPPGVCSTFTGRADNCRWDQGTAFRIGRFRPLQVLIAGGTR